MEFAFVCAVVILIFLNGATDAAGAVATAVSSGALSMGRAAVLSAVLNVAGGVFGASLFPRVGDAVLRGADFGGWGLLGGVAALGAAVLFTFAAWILHLPTSESHALLAAQAGAAAVLGGGGDFRGLFSVFLFMSASGAAGFIAGFLLPRAIPSRADGTAVRLLQVLCAAAASFLHGAQDLVKFYVLLRSAAGVSHPTLLPVCAAVMGLGTLCGGRRMTDALGRNLASLTPRAALGADLSSSAALCVLSLFGIPASTTHTKTAATAAAALCSRGCRLRRAPFLLYCGVWVVTFPVCMLLGVLFARLGLLLL